MLKVVHIRGGLGNQMFGYSFSIWLKNKYKYSIVIIDPIETLLGNSHHGYELKKVFEIKTRIISGLSTKIQKLFSIYPSKKFFSIISEEKLGEYSFLNEKKTGIITIYNGYWQTYKFAEEIKSILHSEFKFNESSLNKKSIELLSDIHNTKSISIHVRRGDYIGNEMLQDICNLDYFKKAIQTLKGKMENPNYFIFSDDIEWVKKYFTFIKYTLVDCNHGSDHWQDMYLMSQCNHSIISNSSFSWWAAWLNANPGKIVISPRKWLNGYETPDIVPDYWIKI